MTITRDEMINYLNQWIIAYAGVAPPDNYAFVMTKAILTELQRIDDMTLPALPEEWIIEELRQYRDGMERWSCILQGECGGRVETESFQLWTPRAAVEAAINKIKGGNG